MFNLQDNIDLDYTLSNKEREDFIELKNKVKKLGSQVELSEEEDQRLRFYYIKNEQDLKKLGNRNPMSIDECRELARLQVASEHGKIGQKDEYQIFKKLSELIKKHKGGDLKDLGVRAAVRMPKIF